MNELRFIKTVTFGGFDKDDVLKRIEALIYQNNNLKNELRDTKYLLNALRSGTNVERTAETVLEVNRGIITKFQTANETLSDKLDLAIAENAAFQQKIAEMQREIDDLSYQLKKADNMITALQSSSKAEAFKNVFEDVQKASDMLIMDAKNQSAQIMHDAEKVADETIASANTSAKKIISEANVDAATIIAEAEKKAEEMTQNTFNTRSALNKNANTIAKNINSLKFIIDNLTKTSKSALSQSDKLVNEMTNILKSEGVSFDDTEIPIEPSVPEPIVAPDEPKAAEEPAKETVQEEIQPAENETESPSESEEKNDEGKPTADNSAQEEDNQSVKAVSVKPVQNNSSPKQKKGKIDLAALAAQANAINKKK